jgi:hypothetical protein
MDGWQLPLAPEQGFSLALAQERVGVMQFSTPSEAMTMNFSSVTLGARGERGLPGELEPFVDADSLVAATLFN